MRPCLNDSVTGLPPDLTVKMTYYVLNTQNGLPVNSFANACIMWILSKWLCRSLNFSFCHHSDPQLRKISHSISIYGAFQQWFFRFIITWSSCEWHKVAKFLVFWLCFIIMASFTAVKKSIAQPLKSQYVLMWQWTALLQNYYTSYDACNSLSGDSLGKTVSAARKNPHC